MQIPRWVWWLLGIVTAIVVQKNLMMFCFILPMVLSARPHPFEEKVQLRGAAVWSSGTEARSADGDNVCELKYILQFARSGQKRENVEAIESSECNISYTVSPAAWFILKSGTYLRIGDDIYLRDPQRR